MATSTEELKQAVIEGTRNELKSAVDRIDHCLNQLSDEELWWRSNEHMNSVANLLLHVSGNMRQWIIAGVGNAEDLRQRQTEFDARETLDREELRKHFGETVDECLIVLSLVEPETLVAKQTIQGFPVNGFQAILHSVSHLCGHVQEIVHITRLLRGQEYRFAFVPRTPEEGA